MTEAVENTPFAWSLRATEAPSSHEAAGWSERGQTQRFLAVLRHLDLHAGQSLLDYGCGTGRLASFMPIGVGYYGYDTAPGMILRARYEHRDEGTFLGELKPDWRFDHIVCVGTFNLPGSIDETRVVLSQLWARHQPKTLIASLYNGKDARCLNYDSQWAAALGWSLSPRYLVDRTYLANDLMLVVKR